MTATELIESPTAPERAARPEPRPTTPPATPARGAAWSLTQRIGFRFAVAYFLLYLFPFPLSSIPIPGVIVDWCAPPSRESETPEGVPRTTKREPEYVP